MTGKLVKYEVRSSIGLIGIIWAALIAASILAGISSNAVQRVLPDDGLGVAKELFSTIPPILYGAIFMAMIVVTVMIIVLRFYRGMLGDEGYLMHTLPVKVWQLVTSKGIVAAGIVLISSILAVLSIMILIGFTGGFREMMEVIGELFQVFGEEPQSILVMLEIIVVLVVSVLKSVYQIYAAMAIGQLAGKYRLLFSLAAYIAINIALTIIVAVIVALGDLTGLDVWLSEVIDNIRSVQDAYIMIHLAMLIIFLATAVQLAAFHVITERILTKKLNLI